VDLPGELARREARLAKMREAKRALEAEAAAQARVAAEQRERDRQIRRSRDDDDDPDGGGAVDEQAITAAGERAAQAARPQPKAQQNFTDPESRIMKNSDGAFIQGYNGQAVGDADHQIIVGADVTECASDCPCFTPMLDQAEANTGAAPREALVDAGYCSQDNLNAAAELQTGKGTETFMVTGSSTVTRCRPLCAGASRPTPPPRNGWPASCAPSAAGPLTPAARRSWNRCSGRWPSCKTPNACCCAVLTAPAANGGYSPPAITSARSSPTPDRSPGLQKPPRDHNGGHHFRSTITIAGPPAPRPTTTIPPNHASMPRADPSHS
jgi:hypothetical protein